MYEEAIRQEGRAELSKQLEDAKARAEDAEARAKKAAEEEELLRLKKEMKENHMIGE